MKIKKITIENFRSIQKAEVDPSDFNFFVGQNKLLHYSNSSTSL